MTDGLEKYLDPSLFYRDASEPWEEALGDTIDPGDPLIVKFQKLIEACVSLPSKDQYKAMANFAFLNSKWCKSCPVGFSYGVPNSGKSTIGNLINAVRGYRGCFSPTDTFSGIRNSLDERRWYDKENKLEKDGTFLVWDNINPDTFRKDNRVFQLLLIGYSRQSSIIKIATPDGGVIAYDVFSPKLISSVFPLHCSEGLAELASRMLIFHHENLGDDFEPLGYRELDFSSLVNDYFELWQDELRLYEYVKLRKSITRKKTPKLKGRTKEISIDLIVTGVICELFPSENDAIEYWSNFFESQSRWLENSQSDIGSLVHQFVNELKSAYEQRTDIRLGRELGEDIEPFTLEQSLISQFLNEKKRLGEISALPKGSTLEEVMMGLGLTRIVENKKVLWR